MASASVVITQSTGSNPVKGELFNGLRFFLVQRLPSRTHFIEKIESNGGRVVRLETEADHIVADHARKDCPPGSISFRFIDAAIAEGRVPDPADHAAGPRKGTVRNVGYVTQPKGRRTLFTAEDDRILWLWVQEQQAKGGLVKGNIIYERLEEWNPRHTSQSWRDRYIKKLMFHPPAGVEGQLAQSAEPKFTVEDLDALLATAEDVESIEPDRKEAAWSAWAKAFPQHSVASWISFYERRVRPAYFRQQKEKMEMEMENKEAEKKIVGPKPQAVVQNDDHLTDSESNKSYVEKEGLKQENDNLIQAGREGCHQTMSDQNLSDRQKRKQDSLYLLPRDVHRSKKPKRDDINMNSVEIPNARTSEQQKVANQQIQNIALEKRSNVEEWRSSFGHLAKRLSVEKNKAMKSQSEDRTAVGGSNQVDAALLETNPASEQFQHEARSLLGQDLTEGDDMDSQNDSIDLPSTVAKHHGQTEASALISRSEETRKQQPADEDDEALESLHITLPISENNARPLENVEQGVNMTERSTLKRSTQSPPRHPSPQQNLRSKTQITYPSLPNQDEKGEMMFSHQPQSWNSIPRPQLHEQQHAFSESRQDRFDEQLFGEAPASSQSELVEDGDRFIFVNKGNEDLEDEIDLSVPEPEGGFGFSSSPMKALSSPHAHHSPISERDQDQLFIEKKEEAMEIPRVLPAGLSNSRPVASGGPDLTAATGDNAHDHQALYTQDILNAETQQPDFEMPLPPGSDTKSEEGSLDLRSSCSPAKQQSRSENILAKIQKISDDHVGTYIDTMTARGYEEASVINALKGTSMRPELAELVLVDGKLGKGLANDVPGIWSEEDDQVLESGDATRLRALEEKHSWVECEDRMRFLADWRDEEEDDTEDEG